MDIRKKWIIAMFIYNLVGTLAVCSLPFHNPSNEGWIFFFVFLTLPISFISFAGQFNALEPLYVILSIQFIMLIISTYFVDLIVRNYSPAYLEKRRTKYISKKQREFEGAATAEQITIYLKYKRNINDFNQTATPEEKATLSVEQWYTIDNLVGDILLIKKGQVSQSTINSIGKRIKDKLRDQAAMDLLLTIE